MFRQSNLIQMGSAFATTLILAGCDSTQIGSATNSSDLNVNTLSLLSAGTYCEPIKVDISGARLLGHTNQNNSTPKITIDNSVPPGDYRIRLHYEDETHPDQADQPREQWYAEFFDKYGNSMLITPESNDLPTDEIISYTDLHSQNFPTGAYSVRAVHAYQTDAYNSISPTMIELYPYCDEVNTINAATTPEAAVPEISLIGDNPLSVYLYDTFDDPGATAVDNADRDISSAIVVGGDFVNMNVPKTYYITYDVEDSSGEKAKQVTRTVNVMIGEEGPPLALGQ